MRFLLSGGSAAVVEIMVFTAIVYVVNDWSILFAQSVSFTCGLVVSYILNRKWVFRSTGSHRSEFTRYVLLATLNLVLSNYLIMLIISVGAHKIIAKLITMVLVAGWNYIIFRRFIFAK